MEGSQARATSSTSMAAAAPQLQPGTGVEFPGRQGRAARGWRERNEGAGGKRTLAEAGCGQRGERRSGGTAVTGSKGRRQWLAAAPTLLPGDLAFCCGQERSLLAPAAAGEWAPRGRCLTRNPKRSR